MTPGATLERGAADLALELTPGAVERMLRYVALLEKWNHTYNLTAVREPREMISHHLLDSLAVVAHLPMPEEQPLLADAGSGAGLPGIPLALARPAWRVTLIESSDKKAAFLRQAALELGMNNVEVHQGRVEKWQPARKFDVVVSRAFAELQAFVAACRHLVAPSGTLAAMKGRLRDDELAALPADCRCADPIPLRVPFLDAERSLVLCRLRA